jgi:hypothetical protein
LHELSETRGKPLGEPYSVVKELAKGVPGLITLRLPETVTGGAVAVCLIAPAHLPMKQLMLYVFPLIKGSAMTLAIQVYTTYRLSILVREGDADCSRGDFVLRLMCLGVFLVPMMNGIRSLVDIHRFLNRIRPCRERQDFMMQWFQETCPDENETSHITAINKVVSCMSWKCRLSCYSFLTAKLITLLWLVCYGSAFILHSAGDENLILNAVALCFVLDVDSYIYDFVTNGTIKQYLSALPAVGLSVEETKESAIVLLDQYWPVWSLTFLGMAITSCYWSWCEVIP